MPESYIPLRGRAHAVTVVFAIIAVVCAGAVVSDWLEWRLLDRLLAGEPVTDAEATANDDRQGAIGLLQLALLVAGAVVFIRWLHAAYRNLAVVAPPEKRYSAGWAIGSWFVPIMNLFRPKQIVNDVWRAGGHDGDDAKPGLLLLGWWLLWVISSFVVNVAGRSYMKRTRPRSSGPARSCTWWATRCRRSPPSSRSSSCAAAPTGSTRRRRPRRRRRGRPSTISRARSGRPAHPPDDRERRGRAALGAPA